MSDRDIISEPIIRTRVIHSFTIRNGWTCSETTVEVTTAIPSREAGALYAPDLKHLLAQAYDAGLSEAQRRNAMEGRN